MYDSPGQRQREKVGRGRKIDPVDRAERMATIARMDLDGYPVSSIAPVVGLAVETVYRWLGEISQQYVEAMVKDRDALVARKLVEYRRIRMEAWQAYERSKRDAEQEVEEHALRILKSPNSEEESGDGKSKSASQRKKGGKILPRPEMVKVKHTKMRKGRLPGHEYLKIVLDTYEAERKLLGLDEAIKLDLRAQVIDWSVFNVVTAPQRDVIDMKIQEEISKSLPMEVDSNEPEGNGKSQLNRSGQHTSDSEDES